MDKQALSNFHSALIRHGFMGGLEALTKLFSEANAESRERRVTSFWESAGTPVQAETVTKSLPHARKHGMKLHYDEMDPEHVIFAQPRSDRAVRLCKLDLTGKCARLSFFRGDRFIGDKFLSQN